jgi:iron complex transport system ATP-binding protein
MNMNKEFKLKVENLKFSYDEVFELKDINLKLEKGKFYSILGPNGCGKTTLVRNILRTLNRDNGSIVVNNKSIDDLKNKELAKQISLVPQNTNIDFDFTVEDIVFMGRAPYIARFSSEKEEDYNIVKKAMECTDTWDFKDKSINSLSGGERQRVIIARAIAQNTDIIVLDEPISNLDIHHQIETLNYIKKLNVENDITVLGVFHDLNLAIAYSDLLIVMKDGEVYSKGKPEDIINEKLMKDVYQINVHIMKNPVNGKPYIIPMV